MNFKQWLEQDNKLRVAHVGASTNPKNPELHWMQSDRDRLHEVGEWLEKRDSEIAQEYYNKRSDDYIDLNDNRDFLKENKTYDIVILHHIYEPGRVRDASPFRISPVHNRQNWIKRLHSTGAKYIFAYGDIDEVSGRWLGSIAGYIGPKKEGGAYDRWVYIKH